MSVKVFMTALNGTAFLGMVRVDGPPEWASGQGRYVREADYKILEAALHKIRERVTACDGPFIDDLLPASVEMNCNQADRGPSDPSTTQTAPMPRGSLPNSLGTYPYREPSRLPLQFTVKIK